MIKNYQGHGYEVLGISVTPDNSKFASCGGDRDVFVWDVVSGDSWKKFNGHTGKVNAVEFNSDASILASGSYDTTVRLWDIKSQQRMPIQILSSSKDSITCVKIQKHLIIVGSVDGYVRTYDIRQGEMRSDFFDRESITSRSFVLSARAYTQLPPHPSSLKYVSTEPVTSLSITKDSSTLLVSTLDSTLRAMDLDNGQLFNAFTGYKNESYRSQACFGLKEESVIIGDEEGYVRSWGVEDGKEISKVKAHERTILWTLHHPKEEQMITASADGSIKIWGR